MKIAIIGYSGSGKSTLARRLAEIYQIPVLFLDTVQFLPNWAVRDEAEGRSLVRQFMQNEAWVIDGNYDKFFREERMEQADTIIFLNFPRTVCLGRAFKRYLQYRNTTRESMAAGCREKMDLEFVWWLLYAGRTKQRRDRYDRIVSLYQDKIIVLKNQKQVDAYIKETQQRLSLPQNS